MSVADARKELAAQQAALVGALIADGPAPAGFAVARLQAAADGLLRKRLRTVVRAWPRLARSLGKRFAARFSAFARLNSLPSFGGPLAEGRAFAGYLAQCGELTDDGQLEVLAVDLHYQTRSHGLEPRRWPIVKIAVLRQSSRVVVTACWPGLGEQWLAIPIFNFS